MDRLWAPWRSRYIDMKRHPSCIFCVGRSARNDAKKYIIERGVHAFSMLNAYPYNNGHVMISPYRHVGDVAALSEAELAEMMRLLVGTKRLLDRTLKPHGYNVGMNIGRAAGAGYDRHVHLHVVPRWAGDTNFMPVTAGSKVVSHSLDSLYRLLTEKRARHV